MNETRIALRVVSLALALASTSIGQSLARAPSRFAPLPAVFVENRGQWDERALFFLRQPGFDVFCTNDGMRFRLATGESLFMTIEGASPDVRIEGREQQRAQYHYFIGNDPDRWVRDVPTYAYVRYVGIRPGVDLVLRLVAGRLEYDLEFAAGVDASTTVIRCDGAETIQRSLDGELLMSTRRGAVFQGNAKCMVFGGDACAAVAQCDVRLIDEDRFTFVVSDSRHSGRTLIDPSLVFCGFLGGSSTEDITFRLATTPLDTVLATGFTTSPDFPASPGSFSDQMSSYHDAFVACVSSDGSTLEWATFLGGSNDDSLVSVAVTAASEPVVSGVSLSTDFPTTPGAFDTTLGGISDVVVAKLSSDGSALLSSTYLGGSSTLTYDEIGWSVAVDSAGLMYVAGEAISDDFPATPGAYDTTSRGNKAFIAVLDSMGTSLPHCTLLGGLAGDSIHCLALTSGNDVCVAGDTNSPDFPVTPGAFDTVKNGGEAFVARCDPTLSTLVFSTFLGGPLGPLPYGLTVDAFGDIIVAGTTDGGFPTTPGAYQTNVGGNGDGFIAKLAPSGATLKYGTYLGKGGTEFLLGLALDEAGNALVCGDTLSFNFPVTQNANQPAMSGFGDVFLSQLSRDGSKLLYSTYIGGSSWEDKCMGIATAPGGRVYVAGETHSGDFPVTPGAFDTTFDTSFFNTEGFLMGFDLCRGTVVTYGQGCPGSMTLVPSLSIAGCPSSGETLTLTVAQGLAWAPMFLAFGAGQGSAPVVASCVAQIMPLFPSLLLYLPLTGQGDVAVTAALPIPTPAGVITLQAFIGDPAAQDGVAATRAVKLVFVD